MVRLSVVMAVFNGAGRLAATLDSIFAQSESDFELIVIDDGSTDDTPSMLASCRDPRLRVITQPNAGLTRALIRGCAEARADAIARHDCGDTSHPDRFRQQLDLLTSDPSIVLVSCATSTVGPGGERLYVARAKGEDVRRSLLHDGLETIKGLTHHGTAMFRRDAYLAAGGYREAMYFAQDLDLWVRLAQRGRIAFVDEVLYDAHFDLGAISWTNRPEQIELTRLILAMRDDPSRTPELLARAAAIRPTSRAASRDTEARALYFVASCLRRERDPRWRAYARKAVARNPLLLRAWALLVRGR
jgi:cellulose synthase/poly-beta-1,6-N-acetylglucosamine synthase-like glycosyltransferase